MNTKLVSHSLFCGAVFAGSFFLMSASIEKNYHDTSLPPAKRAALLLKEMTLEEKIVQMCQYLGPGLVKQNEK